ncbi:MAG: hypothetical protein ACKOAD_05925 [Gammaproteobacteria bacterium]
MHFSKKIQPIIKTTTGVDSSKGSGALAAKIIIKFHDAAFATDMFKAYDSGCPDLTFFKKFSVRQDGDLLQIKLKDLRDFEFNTSLLLATSRYLKENLPQEMEKELLFYISGQEAAGIAMCLESHGLFKARYVFEKKEDQEQFLKLNFFAQKTAENEGQELDHIVEEFELNVVLG